MNADTELATRLSNWGTADWTRCIDLADLVRVSEDCVRALDAIQQRDAEIERLRNDCVHAYYLVAQHLEAQAQRKLEIADLLAKMADAMSEQRLRDQSAESNADTKRGE